MEFDRAPVDFVALVREVVAEHDQRSSKHELRCHVGLDQIVGEWDGRRLASVVGNLLDNAIRYSPDGGPIDVAVQVEGHDRGRSTVLTVRDSGIGVPADEVKGVFDRFHRGSNVRERTGTGIGLASAQSIIEAHGGHDRGGESGGCWYHVYRSIAAEPERQPRRKPNAASAGRRGVSRSGLGGSTPRSEQVARVLVVDDDPDLRMSVQGALEDEGLVVDVARDGAEALVCAARHRPTMVVLDINLPDGPGREVASRLRAQHGSELPILPVTADGSVARKAREVGAFAYLRKPFEMNRLLDVVFRRLAES